MTRTCSPRHWFTYYGQPGTSAPICRRCCAPNPNYDPDRDPKATEKRSHAEGPRKIHNVVEDL